jgi:uncharacterized protein DUF6455
MNATLFELGVALLMVAVSVALVVWSLRSIAAASQRRMSRMFTRAGVAPEVAGRGDFEAVIHNARSVCRRCPSEGLCDRWLAGKVEGDNGFCPNARAFRSLSTTAERVAP